MTVGLNVPSALSMPVGPSVARCLLRVSTAVAICATLASAQTSSRRVTLNLDSNWGYLEKSDADVAALDNIQESAWRRIELPHTWNAIDATDAVPGYRRGASWYRRTLEMGPPPAGSRMILHFEGANTVADVYVNGRRAGGHVGGYIGFDVDVTSFMRQGAPNELRVRVDNSEDPDLIPSQRSDFVIYGGLTRDVWLAVVPDVHIRHLTVRTPEVTRVQARTTVRVEIGNPTRARGEYTAQATLTDPKGVVVATSSMPALLTGDSVEATTIELSPLRAPQLWSPKSPSMYKLSIALMRNGAETDRADERVGYRFYRFEQNGPFLLNGERLLLRGTQIHEEMAGVGAAMSNEMHRRDLELIKGMGANFVRLAHYPQDPEVYRAADSLGLLLWDEVPWDRGGVGGPVWQANTKRLLREQIRQNGNHPSIILWSLANEPQDQIDAGNAGDSASIRLFVAELKAIATEMNAARPTAMRKFDAGANLVDVYSPSIWAGWYRGVYRGYEQAITEAHLKYPHLFHMEYGADAHYGRHSETPINGEGIFVDPTFEEAVGKPIPNIARDGDWSESYQTDLLDWHLAVSERQPWFVGNAQWVFRDFATPLRPDNPIPYVNQKGLFTRDGKPKDAYYVFKSVWTDKPKFAYVVSHTWTERAGPKDKPRSVRVYSNCAQVDLTVNDAHQGARKRSAADFPAQGLRWDVKFAEGANFLVARCTGEGDSGTSDTLRIRYTSEPVVRPTEMKLTARPLPNGNLLLEAVLVDARGRTSLNAVDRIYFDHNGGGRLLADLGTPTGTRAIEAANGRASIEMLPPPPGTRAYIVARTQELNGAMLTIEGGTAPLK